MSDTELLHKSEPVRRLEVFTGAGRRRTWSADQKQQIIAESYAEGETASRVARRHGLSPQQLFAWRRQAREEPVESGLSFAPVVVCGPGQSRVSRLASPTAPLAGATIEIMIGATTIRVPAGADAMTLAAVLRAVRAIS